MNRLLSFLVIFFSLLTSTVAFAGGGGGGGGSLYEWKESPAQTAADNFVQAVASGEYEQAYLMGGEVLREHRTLEEFTADMQEWGFDEPGSVEWKNANNALPAKGGLKLMGTYKAESGVEFPVYIHLEGDAHIDAEERNREWSDATTWTVMDYRSAKSMQARMADGSATPLDWMLAAFAGLLLIAFIGLVWSYVKDIPRTHR